MFEGKSIGHAKIYSNAPNTHRAVVSQHIPILLDKQWTLHEDDDVPPTPASYSLTLQALNDDTVSDGSDHYSVTLIH